MINSIMKGVIVIFSILFLFPITSFAQVVINEIMYDLEGVDNPHEWIEIFVTGGQPLDLTDWRFNDGSNHI
ncbi:lamin tail domain-containing protein, partial [Patescibacteria group bacterium]|nr:lamin tail domain-containing protein [Patescibacteria group bacterium]